MPSLLPVAPQAPPLGPSAPCSPHTGLTAAPSPLSLITWCGHWMDVHCAPGPSTWRARKPRPPRAHLWAQCEHVAKGSKPRGRACPERDQLNEAPGSRGRALLGVSFLIRGMLFSTKTSPSLSPMALTLSSPTLQPCLSPTTHTPLTQIPEPREQKLLCQPAPVCTSSTWHPLPTPSLVSHSRLGSPVTHQAQGAARPQTVSSIPRETGSASFSSAPRGAAWGLGPPLASLISSQV